ncbi:CDP-glycerol glycerophosphotransferase family protein [Labilibaculum antarcticum]|uniref:CDP-glycerol glycerophosphotransferase n=1 Tax=Labilibaculum antarcticum TaxID=1717717 RepID=A0A1Y1CE05_9BACT|nr:CDP-glycerol glycerophosphotransferase family protein [Labilibaculum antarcticum]BAX78588.1 CDP-glycerol glycerophosphotransferase [Labilibaculum antarcticum]
MNVTKYFAVFYTEQIYFLPQFLPVAKEMKRRGLPYLIVLKGTTSRDMFDQNERIIKICEDKNLSFQLGINGLDNASIEYLICGGDEHPDVNIPYKKSVLIVHGIGTKRSAFAEEKNKFDIRFIEGDFRLRKLKELYPDAKTILENVGFSKLDDVLAMSNEEVDKMYETYGFDRCKKTLLYAPTFYPSSLERMPNNFPEQFKDYNLIIKPHFFSYIRKKYKRQRRKLDIWAKYKNVYVAGFDDFNIVPFYALADLLISDESSVVFEFAALDKPVILNRFLKLRLTYRLFGQRKLRKRMEPAMDQFRDLGENIWHYKDLKKGVEKELASPENFKQRRAECTHEIIGLVDGKVSVRMVDVLEKNHSDKTK